MKKYLSTLKKSQVFLGLNEDEILNATLCLCKNIKTYKKGTYLFNEGDVSTVFGIVLSGEVVLQKNDYDGSLNIIARMFPSQIIGIASSFSGIKTHPFDAKAETLVEFLPFDRQSLTRQCPNSCSFHSIIIENLLTVISNNNILLAEKIDILTKRSIKEKILAYLHAQSKKTKSNTFSIPLNRNQMAQFLSIDRSALSRELSKMKAAHILDYSSNHFTLF